MLAAAATEPEPGRVDVCFGPSADGLSDHFMSWAARTASDRCFSSSAVSLGGSPVACILRPQIRLCASDTQDHPGLCARI